MNLAAAGTERDPGAGSFAELYRAHAAQVHRFCLSQLGGAEIAEDLTHETFLRALAVDPLVRPSDAELRPWLIRIARNLTIDHHRRGGRVRTLMTRLRSVPEGTASVEIVAEERERLRRVHAELRRMRPRERELIGLRVAADLTYREIAAIVGIGEAAAKVATHRALARLRIRLEDVP